MMEKTLVILKPCTLQRGLVAAIITYYKGGVRADGAEIVPNDAPEIMNLLKELWATGCTKKVAEGVLAAEFIWGEDLNQVPGLTEAVKADLDRLIEIGTIFFPSSSHLL